MSYPVSDEFLTALNSSHRIATRAELLDNNGNVQQVFGVLSASVTADAGRSVRRTCAASLADPDGALTPGELDDLFAPGQEVKLYRGLYLPSGVAELVPQGVFRIGKSVVRDTGDSLTVVLSGKDRAEKMRRARFTGTYIIAEGTNVSTALRSLITDRTGIDRFNFMLTSHTTPRIVAQAGDDAWKLAQDLARDIGAVLYFDRDGIPTLRAEPGGSAPSAATLTVAEGGRLIEIEASMDEEKTYNHVIVTGEASSNAAPIRAEARDVDPDSGTYVGGYYSNFALGKTVTDDPAAPTGDAPASSVTDGSLSGYHSHNWSTVQESYVQIDLGGEYPVDAVRVWHYYVDGRTYAEPRTEVSTDGITWEPVSTPTAYPETDDGHLRTFEPVTARYVRDYISGSSSNPGNHWVEIEVFCADSSFGDVPYFYTSRFIYTEAQAQDVADTTLRRVSRPVRKVKVEALPAPHVDADDVVLVTRKRAKVDRNVLVRRTRLSLSASEPMTIESQEARG